MLAEPNATPFGTVLVPHSKTRLRIPSVRAQKTEEVTAATHTTSGDITTQWDGDSPTPNPYEFGAALLSDQTPYTNERRPRDPNAVTQDSLNPPINVTSPSDIESQALRPMPRLDDLVAKHRGTDTWREEGTGDDMALLSDVTELSIGCAGLLRGMLKPRLKASECVVFLTSKDQLISANGRGASADPTTPAEYKRHQTMQLIAGELEEAASLRAGWLDKSVASESRLQDFLEPVDV